MLRRCGVHCRTAFVTDVEGDLSYFLRYCERSKVVAWRNEGLVFRDPSSHFVCGGDVFDHGDDITFARALLAFHDAHPSRVHLILGNRDINKMAFGGPVERALSEINLSPSDTQRIAFPFTLPCAANSAKYLPYAEYLEANDLPSVTTRATFIQWALAYKMGAAKAFGHRRNELQRLCGEVVSDDDVAQSFIDAARPGGVYYEYLRRGKIAEILDGALFVHGGVVDENVGFVPEGPMLMGSAPLVRGRNIMLEHGTAEEWLDALNSLKEDSFRRWAMGDDGMFLRQYAFPVTVVPHSVVVHALVGTHGPRYLGLSAVEFLNRSGVVTVCGGHQPAGDIPSTVQQPGLFSLAADNSYCGGNGTRGASVVEVLLEDDGSVLIHGLRADGAPYEFVATDTPVGRHLGDGWWVKARLEKNLYEAQRTRDAYRSKEVQILSADEVEARLSQRREPPVGGWAPERWSKQQLASAPKVVKVKRTRRQKNNEKV